MSCLLLDGSKVVPFSSKPRLREIFLVILIFTSSKFFFQHRIQIQTWVVSIFRAIVYLFHLGVHQRKPYLKLGERFPLDGSSLLGYRSSFLGRCCSFASNFTLGSSPTKASSTFSLVVSLYLASDNPALVGGASAISSFLSPSLPFFSFHAF